MTPSQNKLRHWAIAAGLGCLGLLLNVQILAGDLRIVELVDGSQITGEVVLFEHGVYTVESSSLGRLHIPSSDIRAIRSTRALASPPTAPSTEVPARSAELGLSHYESQIVGDPELLSMVMALQNDPDVLAVLNDPSIMQAIAARDYNALQQNPKILRLGDNPTMRQIIESIAPQ